MKERKKERKQLSSSFRSVSSRAGDATTMTRPMQLMRSRGEENSSQEYEYTVYTYSRAEQEYCTCTVGIYEWNASSYNLIKRSVENSRSGAERTRTELINGWMLRAWSSSATSPVTPQPLCSFALLCYADADVRVHHYDYYSCITLTTYTPHVQVVKFFDEMCILISPSRGMQRFNIRKANKRSE